MNSEQHLLTTKRTIYLYSSMSCLPPMSATTKKKSMCSSHFEISKNLFCISFSPLSLPSRALRKKACNSEQRNQQSIKGHTPGRRMLVDRPRNTRSCNFLASDAWLSSCPLSVETRADPIRCMRWCPLHGIQREVWKKPVLGLLGAHRHTQRDGTKCFEDGKPLTQTFLTCT